MNRTVWHRATEEQVELGELSSTLGFLLRLAQVQVFQSFYNTFAGQCMKPGEITVLRLIGLNQGLRQGVIAKTLMIKPAHMTKLVQRLVDAGYARRTVPPEDRRSVYLSLTSIGRTFVDSHERALQDFERHERRGFTEAEFEQFLSLLQKFIEQGCAR